MLHQTCRLVGSSKEGDVRVEAVWNAAEVIVIKLAPKMSTYEVVNNRKV